MIKEKYYGETISELINFFNLKINGIIHIGAHMCEEKIIYNNFIDDENIIWIEGNEEIVNLVKKNNNKIKIYNEIISDKDDEIVIFNIANNKLSSSILDMDFHLHLHPNIKFIKKVNVKTITLNTFFKKHNIDYKKYNMLVIDIQGLELKALKSLGEIIKNFNIIYTEVNEKFIYKNNCLLKDIDKFLFKKKFNRVFTRTLNYYGDALYLKK